MVLFGLIVEVDFCFDWLFDFELCICIFDDDCIDVECQCIVVVWVCVIGLYCVGWFVWLCGIGCVGCLVDCWYWVVCVQFYELQLYWCVVLCVEMFDEIFFVCVEI